MSLKNSGPNGIPNKVPSYVRLDVASSIIGGGNNVQFTLPPTYISGSAISVFNDSDGAGRILFNEDGFYSVTCTLQPGASSEVLLSLLKPISSNIQTPTTNATSTQEYLVDAYTDAGTPTACMTVIFYAKSGWYLQTVQTYGGAAPSEFYAIACKLG